MVIRNGEWQKHVADRMMLRQRDVALAAREMGIRRWNQIEYAVLERNGRISIIPRQDDEDSQLHIPAE